MNVEVAPAPAIWHPFDSAEQLPRLYTQCLRQAIDHIQSNILIAAEEPLEFYPTHT